MGRPKRFGEILRCYRTPRVWCWHDFVDADHCDAADKLYRDWRASGLGPVQAQRFGSERGAFGSMASWTSTDYSYDDESEPESEPEGALEDGTLTIRYGEIENDPSEVCSQIEEALGGSGLADQQRSAEEIIQAHEQAKSANKAARMCAPLRMAPAVVERLVDGVARARQPYQDQGKRPPSKALPAQVRSFGSRSSTSARREASHQREGRQAGRRQGGHDNASRSGEPRTVAARRRCRSPSVGVLVGTADAGP